MRTTAILTAGLLLGAGLLAGCGGDDDKGRDGGGKASGDGYCSLVKSSKDEFAALTGNDVPDFAEFERFLDRADELAEKAPAEIADDWKTLDRVLDEFREALDDAGITLEQLGEAIATGKVPEGVSAEKLTELGTRMQKLDSESVDKATEAITKHAKDECDLDLGTEPSPPAS